MRLQAKTSLSRLLFAALLLGAAFASQAATKDPDELTPTQEAQLKKLFAQVDSRMDAALSVDPKQRAVMESELKALAAMPDGKARLEAGRAYRQRHAAYYGAALKRAGVDLAAVARQLQQVLPGHTFQVTADHMILGQFGETKAQGSVPPPATASTRNLPLSRSASGNCGGPSNRWIAQTGDSMRVESRAVLVAVCTQQGELASDFDLTQASAASLAVRHQAEVSVEVFGLVGIAMGRARAGVTGASINNSLSTSAVAPLLWYANRDSSRTVDIAGAQAVGTNGRVVFRTYASTSGLGNSGSVSVARLSGIRARLTTTP